MTTYFIGGYYEYNQTSNQVTKYYFAGTTRVAMRKYTVPQSMTVEYFLGDHLGSTSLTTDANGAKVSEMRYKPWGEVRYSWTAGLSTTPAYLLPNYTFTSQYSYMDDPTTTGVTEGFGLMFYNARWYDPALGRFAQADTIIPPGVQGLDRYAYVNNAPVVYVDPSGHDIQCPPNGDCYETCDYNCVPPLTHAGDPIPGSDKTRRHGGDEIKSIFESFRDACGWWNNNCTSEFTIEQFLGMYLLFESNIDAPRAQIDTLSEVLATISAQNLYVGGFNPAYCSVGGQCANAVFNFIAANIDGSSGLWGGPNAAASYAQKTGVPKYGSETALRDKIASVGQMALDPSTVISWDRNKGPSSWGNDQSWADALIVEEIWEGFNGLSPNSIYYYYRDAIYFSVDQWLYWKGGK